MRSGRETARTPRAAGLRRRCLLLLIAGRSPDGRGISRDVEGDGDGGRGRVPELVPGLRELLLLALLRACARLVVPLAFLLALGAADPEWSLECTETVRTDHICEVRLHEDDVGTLR